jgi:hypothetical protein
MKNRKKIEFILSRGKYINKPPTYNHNGIHKRKN